jgi:hypothetical protein
MRAIRLLHIRHFHPTKKRFVSEAFKPYGDGVSIIDIDCAASKSGSACEHIRRFYVPGAASEPPVFWVFSTSSLPSGHTIVLDPTESGDKWCHYNVLGFDRKSAEKFYEPHRSEFDEHLVCGNGHAVTATLDKLIDLRRQYDATVEASQGEQSPAP